MKCPILAPTPAETSLGKLWDAVDCLERECGQYDQVNECCSPVALNQILVGIGNVLGKLLDLIEKEVRK